MVEQHLPKWRECRVHTLNHCRVLPLASLFSDVVWQGASEYWPLGVGGGHGRKREGGDADSIFTEVRDG